MTGHDSHVAMVEVLTAEVRVLMVGSRQVTLSVARQLDEVEPEGIIPFGRVRTVRQEDPDVIEVIGKDEHGGLVRSSIARSHWHCPDTARCGLHPGEDPFSPHTWDKPSYQPPPLATTTPTAQEAGQTFQEAARAAGQPRVALGGVLRGRQPDPRTIPPTRQVTCPSPARCPEHPAPPRVEPHRWTWSPAQWARWEALHLIVLAGLK